MYSARQEKLILSKAPRCQPPPHLWNAHLILKATAGDGPVIPGLERREKDFSMGEMENWVLSGQARSHVAMGWGGCNLLERVSETIRKLTVAMVHGTQVVATGVRALGRRLLW
jgi:hypothetical protein